MQKNKRHYEKPKQRFSKKKYEKIIRELYATTPTAELAKMLGLTVKKIKDYIHRERFKEGNERCLRKDPTYLSQVNSKNGKKGGRPRKKTKI